MKLLELGSDPVERWNVAPGEPEAAHVFDKASVDAINAALCACRPLLVRGEPGTGKTQLAEAAARRLKRPFVSFVVDAKTEATDLLWTFDGVRRLADAQMVGALKGGAADLAEEKYVAPGPLWRGFDWKGADDKCGKESGRPPGWVSSQGVVVLIDEIDKADSDVPNGLLEALGSRRFTPRGHATPVTCVNGPPLIVVTTNEERALPDAFVRRCLVLKLALPTLDDGAPAFIALMLERARAHFPKSKVLTDEVLRRAAEQLVEDRRRAKASSVTPPGVAEYLDLLRAVERLVSADAAGGRSAADWLSDLRSYVFDKHPDDAGA